MKIGRVIGTLVAPVKQIFYEGKTILLVRYQDPFGEFENTPPVVAVDRAQAGIGDKVLILKEGSSARDLFENPSAPIRTVIVGVIDSVEMYGDQTWPEEG